MTGRVSDCGGGGFLFHCVCVSCHVSEANIGFLFSEEF